jgi:hypothetical protein
MKQFTKYAGQRRDNAPEASDYVNVNVLAANTGETFARPTGAGYVNFSGTGDFYASFLTSNSTISVPAADVSNGSGVILNPGARKIPDNCTHIALVAPAASIVTTEFYS